MVAVMVRRFYSRAGRLVASLRRGEGESLEGVVGGNESVVDGEENGSVVWQ